MDTETYIKEINYFVDSLTEVLSSEKMAFKDDALTERQVELINVFKNGYLKSATESNSQ